MNVAMDAMKFIVSKNVSMTNIPNITV